MNNREKITLGVFILSICLLVVSNIEKNAYASAMVYPDRGLNIFSESEFQRSESDNYSENGGRDGESIRDRAVSSASIPSV